MSTVTAVPLQPVKRGYLIWLWTGVVLAIAVAVLLARQGDPALLREARGSNVVTTPSGLQYKVVKAGTVGNAHPSVSDVALVSYEGHLIDGSTFDKSQQPVPFPVAPGATVPGFSEALRLMTKGAKYRFWLKPGLAYGSDEKRDQSGKLVIPANSTLVFDVELIDFIPGAVLRQMQAQQGLSGMPSTRGAGGAGALPQGPTPPR